MQDGAGEVAEGVEEEVVDGGGEMVGNELEGFGVRQSEGCRR